MSGGAGNQWSGASAARTSPWDDSLPAPPDTPSTEGNELAGTSLGQGLPTPPLPPTAGLPCRARRRPSLRPRRTVGRPCPNRGLSPPHSRLVTAGCHPSALIGPLPPLPKLLKLSANPCFSLSFFSPGASSSLRCIMPLV